MVSTHFKMISKLFCIDLSKALVTPWDKAHHQIGVYGSWESSKLICQGCRSVPI